MMCNQIKYYGLVHLGCDHFHNVALIVLDFWCGLEQVWNELPRLRWQSADQQIDGSADRRIGGSADRRIGVMRAKG